MPAKAGFFCPYRQGGGGRGAFVVSLARFSGVPENTTKHNSPAPFIMGETFYWIGNPYVSFIESVGDLPPKIQQRILDQSLKPGDILRLATDGDARPFYDGDPWVRYRILGWHLFDQRWSDRRCGRCSVSGDGPGKISGRYPRFQF